MVHLRISCTGAKTLSTIKIKSLPPPPPTNCQISMGNTPFKVSNHVNFLFGCDRSLRNLLPCNNQSENTTIINIWYYKDVYSNITQDLFGRFSQNNFFVRNFSKTFSSVLKKAYQRKRLVYFWMSRHQK